MIRLAFPDFGPEELHAAERVLRSGNLVQGTEVAAFEHALEAWTGARHAICCSSGTSALELALRLLDLAPGDEVVVPAFTFPSPAHAAILAGATVVVADVDPGTWNLTAETLAPCLGPRTRAIVVVDQLGVPADFDALRVAIGERPIALIEDAACAIGSSLRGRAAGHLGDIGTLSFHPRKVVTTAEGGAVLVDDEARATRLRRLRDHGRAGRAFVEPAVNHRLTDVAGAIGCAQMATLGVRLARRRAIRDRYRAVLPGPWQLEPSGSESNAQTVAILLPEGVAPDAADRVRAAMRERGVEAGGVAPAIHLEPSLRDRARVPVRPKTSESLGARAVALPIHTALRDADVSEAAQAFQDVCREVL